MNTTLYKKVYNELKDRIQSGIYPSRTALPSEPKLKEDFSVSLITIRRAIHELVLDGLVESRQGLGNFVRDPAENCVAVGMSSFTSDIASGRLRIVRTLMSDSLVQAPLDISERIGVQQGSMLRCFVRLDNEGGVPMSIDKAYIPPVLASAITPEIAASPLFMHLWQQTSEITLVKTIYDISVEKATEEDIELLQIAQDIPILVTGELIYDVSDHPIAWVVTRYRGDRCRLSGTVTLVQNRTTQGIIGE